MNAARRKTIQKLLEQIGPLRAELENVRDDEQEYYDNMPESFQQGDRAQTAIDALESAESDLEGIE